MRSHRRNQSLSARLNPVTTTLLLAAIFFTSCSTTELATVSDRAFLMELTGLPFRTILLAYDGSDLVDKDAWESAFAEYITENTSARALREVDILPPMKKFDAKQKTAVFKDEGVDCVLVINGGGLSKPAAWSLTGSSSFENIEIWRSMQFRFLHAASGTVLWMGKDTESVDPLLTRDDLSRDLLAAVGAELLQRGFLQVRQQEENIMRGFNR